MPSDQLAFTADQGGKTQEQIILEYLSARQDTWVPMPELVRVSGSYATHSRIAALRKRGHNIVNATRPANDGSRRQLSSYMLATQNATT